MDQKKYRYYAFISYRSTDVKWAIWLQKKLEAYALPTALQQKRKSLPKHLRPIFRDGTDINVGELKRELDDKLDQSEYLIVLCSPQSAASPWVGEEITRFCESGRRDKIVALIIDGSPYCDIPGKECYHPVLKKYFPKGETIDSDRQLLGADIHTAGPESSYRKRERAFMQVVAAILQLPFEELWNRRKAQLIRRAIAWVCLGLLMLTLLGLTWQLSGRPFDAQIMLQEQTPHNDRLPQGEATLTLMHEGDTLTSRTLTDWPGGVVVPKLSGKFKHQSVRVTFRTQGYESIDTTLRLTSQLTLPLKRDDTFGRYAGIVTQEDGVTPIAGVEVCIGQHRVETTGQGYFEVILPLNEQQPLQTVMLSKEGYEPFVLDLAPLTNHMLILLKN